MKQHSNNLIVGLMLLSGLFRIQLVAQSAEQPPKQPTRYVIKALSTLGGTIGVGEAINNKGWITGAANLSCDTTQHATLWRRGVITDLGTLGGPSSRVVGGVKNTKGEVAGGSETSIPDPIGETALLRRRFSSQLVIQRQDRRLYSHTPRLVQWRFFVNYCASAYHT